MAYFGGKEGCGMVQRLINRIPPHGTYIEPFLGHGAVFRYKRPADLNLGVDLDRACIDRVAQDRPQTSIKAPGGVRFFGCDAQEWLGGLARCAPARDWMPAPVFIYADPPYLMSTRKSKRDRYEHELTEAGHRRLLETLQALSAAGFLVLLSGYPSPMYDQALLDWRRETFTVQTRGGPATEAIWMNYPEPTRLHDYSQLGEDFVDRQRIRRKIRRQIRRLARLPTLEREAILDAIRRKHP